MKKRLAIILSVALIFTMLPTTSFAASKVTPRQFSKSTSIEKKKNGKYEISNFFNTKKNEKYVIYKKTAANKWSKVRTLNNNAPYAVGFFQTVSSGTYQYRMKTMKKIGKKYVSSKYSKVLTVSTIDAPQNLTAKAIGNGQVELSWDKCKNATKYKLEAWSVDLNNIGHSETIYATYSNNENSAIVKLPLSNVDWQFTLRAIREKNGYKNTSTQAFKKCFVVGDMITSNRSSLKFSTIGDKYSVTFNFAYPIQGLKCTNNSNVFDVVSTLTENNKTSFVIQSKTNGQDTFTVTSLDGKYSCSVLVTVEALVIDIPATPLYIYNDYASARIDNIKATAKKLIIEGQKTHDSIGRNNNDYFTIRYKIKRSDGRVVDSGTMFTEMIAEGDSFLVSASWEIPSFGDFQLELF